jgi:hypothetical protein
MSSPESAAVDADSVVDNEEHEDQTASPTVTASGQTSAVTTPEDNNKTTAAKPTKKRVNGIGTASAMNKTYIQLVQEAIVAMKDRTGSSLAAIKKYILEHYPDLGGPHFASRVNTALKKYVTIYIYTTRCFIFTTFPLSHSLTQK